MPTEIHDRVSYRFGDFEVCPESRDVRKSGVRLRIREQAFRVLITLLEQDGELVTRDELRQMLWPKDTFVDFDKGLNSAVNNVREALCDSAAEPRYLETVPRHGYRFLVAVEKITTSAKPIAVEKAIVASFQPDPPKKLPGSSHLRAWLAAVSCCLIAALGSIFVLNWSVSNVKLGIPVQITNDGIPKNELVTDGVRIYYAAPTRKNLSDWRTFVVSLNGGEPRPLSGSAEALSPFAISADHTQLLLGSSLVRQTNDLLNPEQLWSQPLAQGTARALSLRAHDAAWSPDDSRIVFANSGHIGLARADGTTIRMLADVPGIASGLRWSPKADRIRFTLHSGIAGIHTAIWEISPKSGNPHALFPKSKGDQGDGEWSPDGSFYFFSQRNNGVSQIWAVPEKKSWWAKTKRQPLQLTTGPMPTFLPTPTPDGKRLLFYGVAKRSRLLKRDSRSGQFTPFLPGVSGSLVDFSKDGKWISYSSYPQRAVWRAASDGSERLQLSPPDMIAMLPTISPDGARIAFIGNLLGHSPAIFVIDRDGSNLQTVVPSEPRNIIEPSWSPDSKSLALSGTDIVTHKPVLYRFDFATRALSVMQGSERLWSPRWSRDGRFIAALATPVSKLMLYDLTSHQQIQLTPNAANFPIWSHQGQYIYFRYGEEDESWSRMKPPDGRIERVTELNDAGALPATPSRGVPNWINWWVGLTPDDSLLVPDEGGSIEIYSAAIIER